MILHGSMKKLMNQKNLRYNFIAACSHSKLLRNFATPCGLSLRSGRLTAINREIPAKFPQISLRETSDNRDVSWLQFLSQ